MKSESLSDSLSDDVAVSSTAVVPVFARFAAPSMPKCAWSIFSVRLVAMYDVRAESMILLCSFAVQTLSFALMISRFYTEV